MKRSRLKANISLYGLTTFNKQFIHFYPIIKGYRLLQLNLACMVLIVKKPLRSIEPLVCAI